MRKLGNDWLDTWLFEKPLRHALLVTTGFFVLFFLVFHPRFDTNDDVRQAMIASGVGITDHPDPHILFPHIYLGEFLSTAYSQLPTIPWYGLMLFASLFVGVWFLVYALAKKRKSPWLWLLWAALPLSLNIQYTGVAFLLSIGSIFAGLSLIESAEKQKRYPWQLAFPVLLIFASLIRWEAFLLAFGLLGLAVFLNRTERLRGGEMVFYAGFVALAIGFLLHEAHKYHYDEETGWENFRTHNSLRGEITDYDHIPYSEKTATLYEEVGWTQSAFDLYQSWFLADQEIHAIDKVAKLNAVKKWSWRLDQDRLAKRIKAIPGQNLFAGLLLIPILFGFFRLDKRHKRFFLILLGFSVSLLLYLAFSQWLHNRVSLPVMAFLLFWVSLHQEKKPKAWINIVLIAFSALYLGAYAYRDSQEHQRMKLAEKEITNLASNENQLVAIWADSFPYEYVFRPFQENWNRLKKLSLLPLGMTVYTPFFEQKMQAYEFPDIHTALQDSNTVLIARPELLPAYQAFMKEYYGKQLSFTEMRSSPEIQFFVWKIYANPHSKP